jgi:hypothetical protein
MPSAILNCIPFRTQLPTGLLEPFRELQEYSSLAGGLWSLNVFHHGHSSWLSCLISEFCQIRRQIALDQADCTASPIVKASLASMSLSVSCADNSRRYRISSWHRVLARRGQTIFLSKSESFHLPVSVLYSSFPNANISFTFCAHSLQLRYHPVDIEKLFGHPPTYVGPGKEVISSGSVALWGQASASFRSPQSRVWAFSAHFSLSRSSHQSLRYLSCRTTSHWLRLNIRVTNHINCQQFCRCIGLAGSEAHHLHKIEQALSMAR